MKLEPGTRLSYSQAMKMRGRAVPRESRGQIIVQKWPEKRGPEKTPVQQAWVDRFKCVASVMKHPTAQTWNFAGNYTGNSRWFIRDLFYAGAAGKLIQIEGETRITTPTVAVNRNSTETLTINIVKTLTPNTLEWDNNQFWNPSVNPSRITFKSPGLYLIMADLWMPVESGTNALLGRLLHQGGHFIASGQWTQVANLPVVFSMSAVWYFHANETMQVTLQKNNANNQAAVSHLTVLGITPESILP